MEPGAGCTSALAPVPTALLDPDPWFSLPGLQGQTPVHRKPHGPCAPQGRWTSLAGLPGAHGRGHGWWWGEVVVTLGLGWGLGPHRGLCAGSGLACTPLPSACRQTPRLIGGQCQGVPGTLQLPPTLHPAWSPPCKAGKPDSGGLGGAEQRRRGPAWSPSSRLEQTMGQAWGLWLRAEMLLRLVLQGTSQTSLSDASCLRGCHNNPASCNPVPPPPLPKTPVFPGSASLACSRRPAAAAGLSPDGPAGLGAPGETWGPCQDPGEPRLSFQDSGVQHLPRGPCLQWGACGI